MSSARNSSGMWADGTLETCRLAYPLAAVCAYFALASPARAEDASEFWPEMSAFVQLNERSRAYFDAAFARGTESDSKSLDLAASLDISLKPIIRKELLTKDWERSRYLWTRIGYVRIFETTDSTGTEVAEDRGVIAIYGKVSLPAAVWLEARTRADLRWIGDEYSTRYRFRIEATREFTVRDHAVVPYFNFEWFYDTRYDDWAKTLWTIGSEVTVQKHFRYEVYFARQVDRLPQEKNLNALGVVFKWYY